MASEMIQPTKGRFLRSIIDGTNYLQYTQRVNVFETITKPYFTGEAHILFNNEETDTLRGQDLKNKTYVVTFDAGFGQIFDVKFIIDAFHGVTNESLRSTHYTLTLIQEEYYKNKANLAQESFKHINGSQAAKILHSKYIGGGLKLLSQSLGLLSKESYVVSSSQPFKAIGDIAQQLSYGQFKTGSTMYFKNRDGHVFGPLEQLFAQLSPTVKFIQEATLGKNWNDMARASFNIIHAAANYEDFKGSSMGTSSAGRQENKGFNIQTKEKLIDEFAKNIPLGKLAGVATGILNQFGGAGRHGGRPNYRIMNTGHKDAQVDPANKNPNEQLYQAMVRDGPSVSCKVPIQGGLNCTVGKGVELKLIPPTGDLNNYSFDPYGGKMLVVKVSHDMWNVDKLVQATTTLQCVKGGRD